MHVAIRSRVGNIVLGLLGALYTVSASATLVYYIVSNWGANGLLDYLLQLALLAAAIGGVLFMAVAADNLKLWPAERSRSAPERRNAVAARS
jgi:Na+/melibiose symporter-like transporter